VVHKLPQVLINVRVGDRQAGARRRRCCPRWPLAEDELGETGRVLLRPSGTEPLVRVMVEAGTEEQAATVAERDRRRGARRQPGPERRAGPARGRPPAVLAVRGEARAASSMTSSRLQKAKRIRWRPASWWS
jgi:hypothetical protein